MIKKLILLWSVFGVFILNAQEYFPKNDGVNSKNTNFTAFTNAKIFITPSKSINEGTLLIQDGVFQHNNSLPKDQLFLFPLITRLNS